MRTLLMSACLIMLGCSGMVGQSGDDAGAVGGGSGGGSANGGGSATGGGGGTVGTGGGTTASGGGSATGGGSVDARGAGGGSVDSGTPDAGMKSAKRGIAYDLASAADLAAISPGVSWWYNWGSKPNNGVPSGYAATYGMDYIPMLWNGSFNANDVETWLAAHPEVQYLLVMNEPNLTDQSNLTPQQAADLWPQYEAVAQHSNVKIVGPAITWGTMPNYGDPVVWMDAFIAAYQSANGGRSPQIDYLAFHWYDYGLGSQLDRLVKYGKPFWVTEMANWHNGDGAAQIDTLDKQKAQLTDLVNTCETRADVFRYAWFTGRINPDPHFDSLFAPQDGQLSGLGQLYITLPY